MEKNELEKLYKVFLDKDIVNIIVLSKVSTPEINDELAEKIFYSFSKLLGNNMRKYNLLVDLSAIQDPAFLRIKGANMYKKIAADNRIMKMALVSTLPILMELSKFILKISKKSKTLRFFNNKYDAVEWLSSK